MDLCCMDLLSDCVYIGISLRLCQDLEINLCHLLRPITLLKFIELAEVVGAIVRGYNIKHDTI